MKAKTFLIHFVFLSILCLSSGICAQDSIQTDTNPMNFKITKAEFDPCGDGLIYFEAAILSESPDGTADICSSLKDLAADVENVPYAVADVKAIDLSCSNSGEGNDAAMITGMIPFSGVLMYSEETKDMPEIQLTVIYSDGNNGDDTLLSNVFTAAANPERNYCMSSLEEYDPETGKSNTLLIDESSGAEYYSSTHGMYDIHSGEAGFQVTIRNNGEAASTVFPSDTQLFLGEDYSALYPDNNDYYNTHYTQYVCRYTVFNSANSELRTEECEYGKEIALGGEEMLRFDITIEHIESGVLQDFGGNNLAFEFRVGGLERTGKPLGKIWGIFVPGD